MSKPDVGLRMDAPGSSGRRALVVAALLGATAVVVAVGSPSTDAALAPMVVSFWIAGLFYMSLVDSSRGAPLEIGTFYGATVLLYTSFPVFGYLANGGEYTLMNDNRLYRDQPTASQIGALLWLYVVHFGCFAVAYRVARGSRGATGRPAAPSPAVGWIAAALLAGVAAYSAAIARAFDLHAETYAEGYLLNRKLPLLLAQITAHIEGMRLTLDVVLVACLLLARKRRWWPVFLGLAGIAAMTLFSLGSRTEFVLVSAATLVMVHRFVRPIGEKTLLAALAVVLSLFLVVGILRDDVSMGGGRHDWNVLAHTNEFEGILANAWDLQRLRDLHDVQDLSTAFVFTDLFTLVPQQLLALDKVSPAEWYTAVFYPDAAKAGFGFAFGTIGEAIVSTSRFALVLRGIGLGLFFGLVQRWAFARSRSFWPVLISVWLSVFAYSSFRATTFAFVGLFAYHVLPVILAIGFALFLFRRVRAPAPAG